LAEQSHEPDTTTGMVIIGAGMAGARACINLRANDYAGPITLIGAEALMPYDRPPLSKSAITDDAEPEPVLLLDDAIAASLKTTVLRGVPVSAIDRPAKTVQLQDGRAVGYTKLLLATGATPRSLTCPGGEYALLLRNFEDALQLRQRFQAGQKIVIIGGGFIGLELASSAAKRGCQVTVIEAQPRILMRGVPQAIAAIVHDAHVTAGVMMLTGTGISHLTSHSVHLSDGRVIAADAIIAGIGAAPETTLAKAAGLAIDNGIACNEFLQTSDPDIYAAGDCCSFPHRDFGGKRMRLEAWRNAQEQSATAALNMLGGSKAHTAIPWFWSDQYDLSLQIAGSAEFGPVTITRIPADRAIVQFHLADDGTIRGASGIGPGNSIGRDIKLAEMMIAKHLKPDPAQLSDPTVQLKALLKG
jgi:3-phenylpropionate/trans-cinnamate dioxygenase ferredoxin reductase component